MLLPNPDCEVERRNLHQFCTFAGADIAVAEGAECGGRVDAYCFENGGLLWDGRGAALRIRALGRFGNNLRQIIHAVHVARSLGLNRVYIDDVNVARLGATLALQEIALIPSPPTGREPILSGEFFYRDCFRPLFRGFDGIQELNVVTDIIIPMLRQRWPLVRMADEDVLHIHLRSGDVFMGARVHPNYVQPPLAYYRQVLRHFQRTHPSARVVVVFEDRRNPCIDGLCEFLDREGIEHVTLGRDFHSAVEELLSARSLATGFGTFATLIGLAAPALRQMYCFRKPFYRATLLAKGASVVTLRDADNSYIAPGCWQNTPEQVRRMLDYPDSGLKIL